MKIFSFSRVTTLACFAGMVWLGGIAAPHAAAGDRVGSDAPHQERNGAATARPRRALPVTVATTDNSVTVATAKAADAKAANKKKAAKDPTVVSVDNKVTDVSAAQSHRISDSDLPVIGSGAPHQERNADPNAHAARLIIYDR